jgi:hypothetical protein
MNDQADLVDTHKGHCHDGKIGTN